MRFTLEAPAALHVICMWAVVLSRARAVIMYVVTLFVAHWLGQKFFRLLTHFTLQSDLTPSYLNSMHPSLHGLLIKECVNTVIQITLLMCNH